jgi:hypothetical protein
MEDSFEVLGMFLRVRGIYFTSHGRFIKSMAEYIVTRKGERYEIKEKIKPIASNLIAN